MAIYTPILYFYIIASEASEKKPADLRDRPTFNNFFCSLGAGPSLKPWWGAMAKLAPWIRQCFDDTVYPVDCKLHTVNASSRYWIFSLKILKRPRSRR